jgi:hypothetical protein
MQVQEPILYPDINFTEEEKDKIIESINKYIKEEDDFNKYYIKLLEASKNKEKLPESVYPPLSLLSTRVPDSNTILEIFSKMNHENKDFLVYYKYCSKIMIVVKIEERLFYIDYRETNITVCELFL